MLNTLKQSWQAFRRAPPGQRFEQRYQRRWRERGPRSALKPLYLAAGLALLLVGIFFLAVPGPGIPVLMLGAALMAGESLRVARWLDRLDLSLRRLRRRGPSHAP